MKKKVVIILSIVTLVSFNLVGQRWSTKLGIGLGRNASRPIEACLVNKGSVMLTVGQYLKINKHIDLGLEWSTTGPLNPLLGGSGECFVEDIDNKTRTFYVQSPQAVNYLLRMKVKLLQANTAYLYTSLGAGIQSNRIRPHVGEVDKVVSSDLAVSPELGIAARGVFFSLRFLCGGSSPLFSGMSDDIFSTRIIYEPTRVRLWYGALFFTLW